MRSVSLALLTVVIHGEAPQSAMAQDAPTPSLRAGSLPPALVVDGRLDEPAWNATDGTDSFTQVDPVEAAPPTARTTVRVLAGSKALVIGIVCDDPAPSGIVSFSVRRDAGLNSEDHVRVVAWSLHGRPVGVCVCRQPQRRALRRPDQSRWRKRQCGVGCYLGGATTRTVTGWTAELRIPVQSLSFRQGLREWHFNVQRRIQRVLETDRWASPARQFQITQTSRGGLLTGLPEFDLGVGLSLRPAVTTGGGVPSTGASVEGEFQPSLDITQRLGSNVLTSMTFNTDFAETEVAVTGALLLLAFVDRHDLHRGITDFLQEPIER